MARASVGVLVLSLSGLVGWSAAASALADPPPATLSRQDMLAQVQAARAGIEDLTVTFSMNAVQAPEDYVQAHFWAVASVKDGMIYTYSNWGRFPERDPSVFEVESSYSGTRSTVHEVQSGFAWVKIWSRSGSDAPGSRLFRSHAPSSRCRWRRLFG